MSKRGRTQICKSKVFIAGVALLLLLGLILTTHIPTLAASQEVSPERIEPTSTSALEMGLGRIFTYFFLMLGPIKILIPFVDLTQNTDNFLRRQLAFRAFLFSCFTGAAAALVGQSLLNSWRVSLPALLIAASIVLFLVALQTILQQYQQLKEQNAPPTPSSDAAVVPLTFPIIITPFGLAVLILFMGAATTSYDFAIFGVFLVMMVINLVTMLFAHQICQLVHLSTLRIVGTVIGVLQIALAIQMLITAARLLPTTLN